MALVATRRVKHQGKFIPAGQPFPSLDAKTRKAFIAAGLAVEQVTADEAAAASAMSAKIAALEQAAIADGQRAAELRGDLEALEAEFADITQLKRAATNASKGSDTDAIAAANAALAAAEAAQTRHAETMAEIQALEAAVAAKHAALDALA